MPDHGAQSLGVGCHVVGEEWWDDDGGVCHLRRVATLPTDDSEDAGSPLLCQFECPYEIDRDLVLDTSPTNREDQDRVVGIEA